MQSPAAARRTSGSTGKPTFRLPVVVSRSDVRTYRIAVGSCSGPVSSPRMVPLTEVARELYVSVPPGRFAAEIAVTSNDRTGDPLGQTLYLLPGAGVGPAETTVNVSLASVPVGAMAVASVVAGVAAAMQM